jgi:hypothetical protein
MRPFLDASLGLASPSPQFPGPSLSCVDLAPWSASTLTHVSFWYRSIASSLNHDNHGEVKPPRCVASLLLPYHNGHVVA